MPALQPFDANGRTIPVLHHGASQKLTVSTTSVASTGLKQGVVRICADVDCYVKVGATPTADATTSALVPGGTVEMMYLRDDEQVAVVRKAADGVATLTQME